MGTPIDNKNLPTPTSEVGGKERNIVTDERAIQLLEQVLGVLKKIEYHLSIGTDTDLTNDNL